MNKTKLLALLGAAMLALGSVGAASATGVASDQGVVPIDHPGNITIDGNGQSDAADCDAADAIETGDTGGTDTTDNGVTVTWTYNGDTKEVGFTATGGLVTIAYIKGGNDYHGYHYAEPGVASDGGLFAPDNSSGGPAGLSHAVFCTAEGGDEATPTPTAAEPTPTFTGDEAGITEAPTDTLDGAGTSGPADGAWLLVVALGVLLASIVVLTPARAKSRR